jgi:O-methyltransferase involved in polyketide biosynthesis
MTSTGSTRYEGDTWDLASSVGVTATMVAAARAMATRADKPLINDPFAEPLVRAVGVDLLARLASGALDPAELNDGNDVQDVPDGATGSAGAMSRMADNMAVRTKFFDDFFLDATKAGIKQAVILASGLDSRAYRLAWPAGTVVYEIDQPQVIEFKTQTLTELGATPTADRRVVAIDLRDDWPAARDSTRSSRPRGAPRACSATCRRRRKTACWTPSPNSARRAAGSPPKARATSSPATSKR